VGIRIASVMMVDPSAIFMCVFFFEKKKKKPVIIIVGTSGRENEKND
jgi:hypothetical protein